MFGGLGEGKTPQEKNTVRKTSRLSGFRAFASQVWGKGARARYIRTNHRENPGLRKPQTTFEGRQGSLAKFYRHGKQAHGAPPLAHAISHLSHDQDSLLGGGAVGRRHPPIIPCCTTAARLAGLKDEGDDVAPDRVGGIFGTFSRDRHRNVRREQQRYATRSGSGSGAAVAAATAAAVG